ncbi:hypothetical protein GCM10009838_66340 [Catenulispora subtropica]|uniref:Signal transduction histidine kinase subgroup 3 dimerisation and phosphoacceptor domain-containing protein n=2 Tax=Catenulispora subtropica TaxID=450798 RepID=A0ABP5E7X9_9ACTN
MLGSGGAAWGLGPMALVWASFAVQSLFIVWGGRLRGTRAGWLVVAVQVVLTYAPFVFFGQDWMPGNAGLLGGALMLVAGPVAGLVLTAGIAVLDLVLTVTVLHLSTTAMYLYPLTATIDNAGQFWCLATLTQVIQALHAERRELARLAVAEERSRAERSLRLAFGRRLLVVESYVDSALRHLPVSPAAAREDAAGAVRVARQIQKSVRSAADGPLAKEPTVRTGDDSTQLMAVAVLGLLLVNYCAQAVADAVDGDTTALTVVGFSAIILAAVAALRRHRGQDMPGPRLAKLLLAVITGGLLLVPAAMVAVMLLIDPPLSAWLVFAAVTAGALVVRTQILASWWFLLTLIVSTVACSMIFAPPPGATVADKVYVLAAATAIAVNTNGMVRLVQFEGMLLSTRRRVVTLAALHERSRVARDVHDLLGFGITAIVLKAELASRLLTADPERAGRHLEEVRTHVRDAAAAAGACLDGGVEADLGQELLSAEKVLVEAGASVDVHVDPVPREAGSVLAVILRESVTNILRHSQAEKVRITVSTQGKRAFFSVENDGVGDGSENPGRGLKNISLRVLEAGGEFDVSHVEERFRLSVELPLPAMTPV